MGATGLVVLLAVGGGAFGGKPVHSLIADAAAGKLKPAKMTVTVTQGGKTTRVTKTMPFFSGGVIIAAQEALGIGAAEQRLEGADAGSGVDLGDPDIGQSPGSLGCSKRDDHANVRVNQDCTFRRQAETSIEFNPADPTNLIAGQNDSRVGFNQCGFDWSTDNGKHWGDELPPFRQKLNSPEDEEPTGSDPNRHTIAGGPGTLHSYDADSDPAQAMDSRGRAFFSCVAFDLASNASLLWVSQSPIGAQGSFYFNLSLFSRRWVVAEDNSPNVFHDKEFVTADAYPASPNRDNVYVTWTVFKFGCPTSIDYCESPIFGSMTTDHGLHWSTPEEISGSAPGVCEQGNFFDPTQGASDCNADQGSDPVVLPNGDLVVSFFNANGPGTTLAQELATHCHPTGNSATGTALFNCTSPVLVSKLKLESEPLCDFGRGPEECIPGAFIRTNPFPRIAVNQDNGNVYVAWQDYQRRDTGDKEWSIQLSRSTNGGATWSTAQTVNPDTGLDHYFPAIDIAEKGGGDRVGISYYRTARVPNENTTPSGGFMSCNPLQGGDPSACDAGTGLADSDYVLSGGKDLDTPFDFKVVSPVFAPPDGAQAGFNGDYSGLAINKGEEAHPAWSDTRNADPYFPANGVLHDEDHFTDRVGLPNGKAKPGPGTIGKR